MKIVSMALSILLNGATAWIAAYPLLKWGVNGWTFALCGALMFPLAMIFRMFTAILLGVAVHGRDPK